MNVGDVTDCLTVFGLHWTESGTDVNGTKLQIFVPLKNMRTR